MLQRNRYNGSQVAGVVTRAEFCGVPAFATDLKVHGARRVGQVYERKALDYLEKRARGTSVVHLRSPWIVFSCEGVDSPRDLYCQPDFLIVDGYRKKLTVVEVKLSHTNAAWWQVRKLYEPILQFMYLDFVFSALELTRFYDPHQNNFPEPIIPVEDPLEVPIGKFGLHIYSPARSGRHPR